MGSHVYNVVKAPIGWSLFCDRERVGGCVSREAALEAATAFGAKAVQEDQAARPRGVGRGYLAVNFAAVTDRQRTARQDRQLQCADRQTRNQAAAQYLRPCPNGTDPTKDAPPNILCW